MGDSRFYFNKQHHSFTTDKKIKILIPIVLSISTKRLIIHLFFCLKSNQR